MRAKQDGWTRAKRAPAHKDTKHWCHGKVGVEHTPEIRMARWAGRYAGERGLVCKWNRSQFWDWRSRMIVAYGPERWSCWHEEFCSTCGKILSTSIADRCPDRPKENHG